jgi:hypothetical protein
MLPCTPFVLQTNPSVHRWTPVGSSIQTHAPVHGSHPWKKHAPHVIIIPFPWLKTKKGNKWLVHIGTIDKSSPFSNNCPSQSILSELEENRNIPKNAT